MSVNFCPRCGSPAVPGGRFCGQCGAAFEGAITMPIAQATDAGPTTPPGELLPWQRPGIERTRAWAIAGIACILAIAIAGFVGWRVGGGLAESCTDPGCVTPILSPPLGAAQPYMSTRYGYSLDATSRCSAAVPMSVTGSNEASIDWTLNFPELAVSDWPAEVHGETSAGRSARQVVEAIQAAKYGDAQLAYAIPMADLGYAPGYGAVYDVRMAAGNAEPIQARLIVIAAVKADLVIVLDTLGPRDTTRLGHPYPAQTAAAVCLSRVINSVTWPGEPPT